MTKKIHPIDQQIIALIESGLSPAQVSFEMERQGEQVSSAYVRRVRDLIRSNLTYMLEREVEIKPENIASTPREYAKKMESLCEQILAEAGINKNEYTGVGLSADRTEYTVYMNDGTERTVATGFDYFED